MISINTKNKYEYELNGESMEMDYPSLFDLAEYQEQIQDAGPRDAANATKELLLSLGMDKLAVKHMDMETLEKLLGELRKGKQGN